MVQTYKWWHDLMPNCKILHNTGICVGDDFKLPPHQFFVQYLLTRCSHFFFLIQFIGFKMASLSDWIRLACYKRGTRGASAPCINWKPWSSSNKCPAGVALWMKRQDGGEEAAVCRIDQIVLFNPFSPHLRRWFSFLGQRPVLFIDMRFRTAAYKVCKVFAISLLLNISC